MDYEAVKIARVTEKCPACEDYAKKNSTNPPKIAVMACEGACARGEVARRAANMVAHRLARDETVRICLGGAFTKDTGQRNLVRRAEKVIAIEGCFINCASRMMAGVIPELRPEIVRADPVYNLDLPFGIDEVPDEMFTVYGHMVAEQVVRDHLRGSQATGTCRPSACGCSTRPLSCGAGPGLEGKPSPIPEKYLPPDTVNVHWEGKRRFRVENTHTGIMYLEDGTLAGTDTQPCTPCDSFMAALGGCANLALLGQLQKNNTVLDRLQVQVSGTRHSGLPAAYEKIHVSFGIATGLDDAAMTSMINSAMTVLCPVAVTLGRATELTWDYERIKTV